MARHNDMVVFVAGAVPGDVIDAQVFKKKKSFMEARPVKWHSYSDKRTEPFCDHFGICGGCKWQFMTYEHQLGYKQQEVVDSLTRIGGLELPEIQPILASEQTTFYRNKLEFSFSDKRWLTADEMQAEPHADMDAVGFHVPGRFDKIVDVDKCWLQPDPSNQIRNAVREIAKANGISFYNVREHTGVMRNMIVRTATTGEVMVVVAFGQQDDAAIKTVMDGLAERFPEITALLYVVNTKKNDTLYDQDILLYRGQPHIVEQMEAPVAGFEPLKFNVGPKSFYQTNAIQARALYKVAFDMANLQGHEVVYDLYTGTGTIACFVARHCSKVVGVESVPEAIEDAKINAQLNGIENTTFYAGDMKEVFNEAFIEANGRPDVVITDPPRVGMHEKVVEQLLKLAPERIVYVSCHPATQARDLALMKDAYKVDAVQPVDMFPHTYHVENVVVLTRK